MKISFVVPAYNEEALIGKCLESIITEIKRTPQVTLGETVEVVVVNNASTDKTKDIALGFPGVRVVDEPRKGLVWARQAGLAASTGELVANIDSDVVLIEGWLAKVLREFAADPKLVALSGPFKHYDLSPASRMMVKFFYGIAYCSHLFNHYVLGVGAMLQGGNFVFRRDAFERVGNFDTTIEFYGEDTDVARRLSHVGKVKWTFALPVYTSARRLKGEGIVYMSMKYSLNYFWVTFFGKPLTKEYKDFRPR